MRFATSLGGTKTLRINAPRTNIMAAAANVNTAATMLRSAGNVFGDEVGTLQSLVSAEVVTETTTTII